MRQELTGGGMDEGIGGKVSLPWRRESLSYMIEERVHGREGSKSELRRGNGVDGDASIAGRSRLLTQGN